MSKSLFIIAKVNPSSTAENPDVMYYFRKFDSDSGRLSTTESVKKAWMYFADEAAQVLEKLTELKQANWVVMPSPEYPLFNLVQKCPNYYGDGKDAHFYLLNFHRYSGKSQLTCSLESAGLFDAEDAAKALAQLAELKESNWSIEPYVESNPPRQHNLRCCYA